ncbi:hypothetical protein OG21DRAFT_1486354 [Imleria badia]|nr:hypothetical protein OG21DRAFT_1486354 [Imleria badia]
MARAGPGPLSPGFYVDVPMIVHNLIRDMQALETALHRWARAQATPADVSNCYVQWGIEFNAVIHAFEGYDIHTVDLRAIPTQLRSALEECLGEHPSRDTLDRYMPEIRRLLAQVLRGLRAKHPAWRNAASRSPTTASYSPGGHRFPAGPFP